MALKELEVVPEEDKVTNLVDANDQIKKQLTEIIGSGNEIIQISST